MVASLDQLLLLLAHLDEAEIPDCTRLDDLCNTRPELTLSSNRVSLAESVEKRHVHEDHSRLVEGSNEVLSHRGVDGRLASHRRINHCEQRGGHLVDRVQVDHSHKALKLL